MGSMDQLAGLKKSRFRFSDDYDLHLAREVLGQNPYEDPHRWNLIQVHMLQITGKQVTIRTLRDRILNLVKKQMEKNQKNEGKSGIEEIVTELDDLIQQIIELMKAFQVKNKNVLIPTIPTCTFQSTQQGKGSYQKDSEATCTFQSTQLGKSSYQKGYEAREKAVKLEEVPVADIVDENGTSNFYFFESENEAVEVPYLEEEIIRETDKKPEKSNQSQESTNVKQQTKRPLAQKNILTPRKRTNTSYKNAKTITVQYLDRKSERQHEPRTRELDLRERQLSLESRRLEQELEERKKRMDNEDKRVVFEEKRLQVLLDMFETQKKLIEIVLKKY